MNPLIKKWQRQRMKYTLTRWTLLSIFDILLPSVVILWVGHNVYTQRHLLSIPILAATWLFLALSMPLAQAYGYN